jgi:hypothetical protein
VQEFDEVLRLEPQNRQALEFKQQILNNKFPEQR